MTRLITPAGMYPCLESKPLIALLHRLIADPFNKDCVAK